MGFVEIAIGLIATFLKVPVIRTFFRDVAIGVAAEILANPSFDPEFKARYTELTSQLVAANTEEAKREILQQIRALRGRPTRPS